MKFKPDCIRILNRIARNYSSLKRQGKDDNEAADIVRRKWIYGERQAAHQVHSMDDGPDTIDMNLATARAIDATEATP